MGSLSDMSALRNASESAQAELDAITERILHHPSSQLMGISVSVDLYSVTLCFGFTDEQVYVHISADPDDPGNWEEDAPQRISSRAKHHTYQERTHPMSHDTFYICPHCESLTDLPEVQWACNQHVLTRARRGEKPGKFVVNYEGDLLVVGKAVTSPRLAIGDPLVGDRYGVLRDTSRHLDKFGVLHDCPICGMEVEVALYQCEHCRKPVRAAQVATYDVFHPPVGLAAANLVLQREGDPKARWVA